MDNPFAPHDHPPGQPCRYCDMGLLRIVNRGMVGPDKWDAFVDAHPLGGFRHRWEWIDYALAYGGGQDMSGALVNKDMDVHAVIPLVREGAVFTCGKLPTPFMLCNNDLAPNVAHFIMNSVHRAANLCSVTHGLFMTSPARNDSCCSKAFDDGPDSIESMPFHTRVIDLAEPPEARWKQVRKSYRQLIHRGHERYAIIDATDQAGISGYQDMHMQAYQAPRPLGTYAMMGQIALAGRAVIFRAMDKAGRANGYSYWALHKDHAYYGSGVYAEPNVTHVMMWDALQQLGQRGIKTVELGWVDRQPMTDKEKNVAFFKQGFGGQDWTVPCMRWIYCTEPDLKGAA